MTAKAERTRELLVDTALRLLRDEGYEATTMRRVATEAGVSTGNAYYYFAGKDALVQELFDRVQADHRAIALPRLVDGDPVGENLRRVLHAGLDVMAPYHALGATMIATALRPASDISPFSAASSPARAQAVALMAEAVGTSRGVPRGALADRLPTLLLLAYLGVTLHWVHDATDGQRRTRDLVDGLAPLLGRALNLARLPIARGVSADVVALVDRFAPAKD
ncbi:TetR/AcrR family transcriptional regulator [Mariniluteicoccus flavus]